MSHQNSINRRKFLGRSAAALTILPRTVIGGPGSTPPSDRIRIGYVGVGTQGVRQLMQALGRDDVAIVSVCDPNRDSSDYIEWYRNELRDKIRAFLEDPNWGSGMNGCRCGRELGKELVERHQGRRNRSGNFAGCSAYSDFREMLEQETDLDAVYIMAPDHLHASIAIPAMEKGKHVITHKPISNVFHETERAVETAARTKVATHMFCSADADSTPILREWIRGGAIGPVREVHNWSTRPFWPQGMSSFPSETIQIPEGLRWDLWLGPVPDRPYHPALTHAVFRGWYDFGTGALGDMGHYSFFQIFRILDLGSPISVEASRSESWEIAEFLWRKEQNTISYPQASMIRWEFGARDGTPSISLHWYDGSLRPPKPVELEEDMPAEGLLFVGDHGKILAGFRGQEPRLLPADRMRDFQPPAETPRPAPELDQWLRAVRGGPESDAGFQAVRPVCETIHLGNVALRVNRKLNWDAAERRFTNSDEANGLLRRERYRPDWDLFG